MQLELTPEEAALLDRILHSYLSDLRMEMAGTENPRFREGMKREKEALLRIESHLQGSIAHSA